MLKKSQIDLNQHEDRDSDKINVRNSKLENKSSILSFIVGSSNVKRWNALKIQFSCKTNEIFASKLLNLAQDYLNDKKNNKCKEKSVDEKCNGKTKKIKKNRIESIRKKLNDNKNAIQIDTNLNEKKTIFKLINENKCQVEILEIKTGDTTITPVTVPQNTTKNDTIDSNNGKSNDKTKKKKICTTSKEKQEVRKKVDFDVRKAPQLDSQTKVDVKNEVDPSAADMVQNDSKIKICKECNTRHNDNQCPINFPSYTIQDQISQDEWIQKFKSLFDDQIKLEKDTDNIKIDTTSYCFSQMSLPNILYLDDTNTKHGLGVFTNDEIKSFTQFGPLIGKGVKEVDIPEDFNMRDLWHFPSENGNNLYINTEDLEASNWMRYIRPAPTRDEKNLIVVMKNDEFHVVTTKVLYKGDELLYWQENALTTNKKKLEKTSCGGCNMNFAHPFYYRTHCSVFHDVRFSLTIRKYHCKVCGAAILGKENIMKHAVELHNGQGAYQCQYCKKFFLRLNYLEMHRTYGCSANPHRSRPLCDFCGRKFCQPQKLKVHIKRMHSDFSEVLKEFQCKNCLKILGSRAALQRHLKEVHQKQVAGAYCCSRCGKHFQNKSNLKIHMLTHSGIKPFKCTTVNCNAAFTTKQCLQFHYKKVHNFTEDSMPKIERSVDYTFQAYSGFEGELEKTDGSTNSQTNMQNDDEYGDSDDESLDNKSVDDPPALQSPLQVTDDQSSPISISPPIETYVSPPSNNVKVLTKGSKKWIGDQPLKSTDVYQMDHRLNKEDLSTIALHVQEPEMFDRSKLTNLSDFGRQEASNASLLVEAALDSVCSEPNIDIDVSSTPNCTDSIVNNLYNLAQPDDVTYSETVCMSEPRELNLISPSVNDHISVTDELNDELRHDQSINMDYSNFHQEEFSPANSPGIQHRSSFVRNYINNLSPHYNEPTKNISPVPSPPRYDFGHAVTNEHLSSDDSNGMAAQNLSLNNPKNDIQLDLSIYKSPYKFDIPNYQKKDFRLKYDIDIGDRKHILNNDNIEKHYGDNESSELEQEPVDSINQQHDLSNNMHSVDVEVKEIDVHEERLKYPDDLSSDIRNKFEIDLDMRLKNYEIDSEALRQRSSYEAADLDFRSKNYDLIDSIESRVKSYDNIETDFRSDRNFEPLVLNSSEIQGLDMSARSFHNYSNINRYHHLYPEVDRVDLRLNYSPPPPTYTHADLLRVVSLDLTPPGRHSVDLSLRSHSLHQIANTRLLTDHTIHQTNTHRLLDQSRLLSTDLSTTRHLSAGESRLITESSTGRILSDHTTSRILANDQLATNHLLSSDQSRLLSDETRLLSEQPRLLEQSRLIGDSRILPPTTPSGPVSPVPTFSGYGVSQSPFHPPSLQSRSHVTSPTPPSYHHYSSYY